MNLLPETERENLKKGLKNRFIIIALFFITASFLVGFIMLLPSYFLTLGNSSENVSVNFSQGTNNKNKAEEILNLPKIINAKLKFFQLNIKDMSIVDYFSKIIDSLPKKVTLNSIYFSRETVDSKGNLKKSILVSGIASDRNSLISFSKNLENSNLFSSVEVPVSSLTRDKNLPFSINLFIKK